MFPKFIELSQEQLAKMKHPFLYKSIRVQIKFDGASWVDVSSYVKAVKINNDIDLAGHVKADSFSITVANQNNEWSKTQYWDQYDPEAGKFNGTQSEAYLSKVLPVIVSTILDDFTEVYLAIGYITDITENVSKRTATLQCTDILWKAAKKKLEETLVYVDKTPNFIIEDLAFRSGFSSFQLDIQELLTVINTKLDKDETYLSAIDKIVQGNGGKLSATPDGKIIFRSRFENYTDPAIVDTLTAQEIQSLKIPEQRNPINRVEVHSEGYSLEGKQKIFESTETLQIAPGATYPESGVLTLTFENELNINIEEELEIKYDGSALGRVLRLGDGEDDGELKVQSLKIFENRAEVVFENLGSGNIYIRELRMYGEPLKKISENEYIYENDTDDEDSTLSVETFYEDSADLETIAKIYREDKGKKVLLQVTLNEFWGHVYAGNLIEVQLPEKGITSGTLIITSVTHNIRERKWSTTLSLAEFKELSYFVGSGATKIARSSSSKVAEKITQVRAEKVNENTVGYWRDSLLDVIKFALPYGMSTMKMTDNVEVGENNIPPSTITETHIADDSISTPKLKANSVTADKLSATIEMFVGQILKVGGRVEIFRDATTGEGKIIVKNAYGNELIRIGEAVLPDGSDGIWLKSSNLVVDGEIEAKYIKTSDMFSALENDFSKLAATAGGVSLSATPTDPIGYTFTLYSETFPVHIGYDAYYLANAIKAIVNGVNAQQYSYDSFVYCAFKLIITVSCTNGYSLSRTYSRLSGSSIDMAITTLFSNILEYSNNGFYDTDAITVTVTLEITEEVPDYDPSYGVTAWADDLDVYANALIKNYKRLG